MIGIALHKGDVPPKKFGIKTFQLMTQNTKDGTLIWTPDDVAELRRVHGDSIKLYSHAMFKIVLGRYFPTMDYFCEHYKYLCHLGFHGYVVHIPANIEMDYCVEFIKKMFKRAKAKVDSPSVRVYFEHVPSEMYSLSRNMAKFGRMLKSANLVLPVGLCIDTCHLYVSGVSLEDRDSAARYFAEIETSGLPYFIHLNDSVGDYLSFVDRHGTLGTNIWLEDKSGLKYIKSLDCDKIIELSDSVPSLELLSEI
jgi:deoxyribonuclease-4